MKPIFITLLFAPLILFVVAVVYLWWQRASAVASTRRRIFGSLLGANLVLGPLGLWYLLSTAHSNFDVVWIFVCFGFWTYAVVDCIRQLRNDYKRSAHQRTETKEPS
jgi:CDP-diglyceride synthetase